MAQFAKRENAAHEQQQAVHKHRRAPMVGDAGIVQCAEE